MEYARLLRQRPVVVLWLARSLSALGDRLYAMAVMWSVWASTGSASLTGLVALLESLPYVVFGTVGRRVVARFASYGALSAVDALRAGVAVALPFVWSPDVPGTVVVLVSVFLLGVLGALFDPNFDALVPGLGRSGQVQSVTGLFDLTYRVARIAGHACAGALLLVFSRIELFACVGAAFAVSAAALGGTSRRLPVPPPPPPLPSSLPLPPPLPSADASAGDRPPVRVRALVRERPGIGMAIGVHGLLPFCAAAGTIGLPALLADGHDAGSGGGSGAGAYGLITAVSGIGALIGNPVAGALRPRAWLAVCCAAWTVDGLATVCVAAAGSVPAFALLYLLSGLAAPLGTVTIRARLGTYAPAERLRLMAVEHTATRTGGVAAILLLPPLVDASPRGAFLVAGSVVVLITAAVGLLSPRITRGERAEEARAGRAAGARAGTSATATGRHRAAAVWPRIRLPRIRPRRAAAAPTRIRLPRARTCTWPRAVGRPARPDARVSGPDDRAGLPPR
ncbi:hypothetical protein GO001_30390 [Streptomyces sp. NRRL B-1677]|uniref:MFS transporter n=1 Tax=Streptomyces klenkii TaxID=1420899 RepID=A0A3B0BY45_9ACTN|nr:MULTISPECIES: MFS transporter [Streptomyces]MBF6049447.1 hypothetical protein [Streptomyces sp. NRRL B-1677]RKN77401.1 hypothetical protein D7231_01295 [Streptomyces klenkii]